MHQAIWNRCLRVIRDNIPAVTFRTWFQPIVPLKLSDKVLTIQVPSPFFYEYLEENFIDLLRKCLRKELGTDAKLEYSVVVDKSNVTNQEKQSQVIYPSVTSVEMKNNSLPLSPDDRLEKFNPFVIPGIRKLNIDPQLNPEKSFDNLVEGECNRLARSAGVAVGENPGGTAFNPLFVYGESGLGKTHLAQAIGLGVKERFPDKVVLYVTANKFQTQFVDARLKNEINKFLHFYQMIDLLIIDDIHEFAGREKTQDVFFHIFNHLHQSGKQLILTSDKPPVELQGLEKRLLSRFKWGLSADLQAPDYATRVSILRRKAYQDGITLPDDVIAFVASNITSNVRELEGAIISLLAQSTLNRRAITLELASEMIEKLIKNPKQEISIDFISKTVCNFLNITIDMLHSSTRKREIVQARQIAMFFSKKYTKAALASIGKQVGGKDHATVLHACKTVMNMQETDKRFKQTLEEIDKKFKH